MTASRTHRISSIFASISSVAALTLLIRIMGFFDKVVLTSYFDLSNLEVFFVAISLPGMMFTMAVAIAQPIVLPGLAGRFVAGNFGDAAKQLHTWLLTFIGPLLIGAALLALFPGPVTRLLAPGFDAPRREICEAMIVKLAPFTVVMCLLPLLNAFLNAQRKFIRPPFGELAMKLTAIVIVVGLGRQWGVSAALWGTALGMLTYFLVVCSGLHGVFKYRPSLADFKTQEYRRALLLMVAPCIGTVLARMGEIVERAVASTLAPGSVAALVLARKLVDLPLLIVSVASATVLFTYFAELNHAGARQQLATMLGTGIRAMTLIFLPITILTCLLAEPVVALVYHRGHFEWDAVRQVAQVLSWLAPSMIFVAVEMLLMRHFFSRLDVWTPTLIGALCVIIRICLLWLLPMYLGLPGVALAVTVSRGLKVGGLILVMRKWRERVPFSRMLADGSRIAAAAVAAALVVLLILRLNKGAMASSFVQARLIVVAGTAGMATFAVAISALWRGRLREALLPGRTN